MAEFGCIQQRRCVQLGPHSLTDLQVGFVMEFPSTFDDGLSVLNIENPRWADAEHIRIDADITFEFKDGRTETVPFTSCPFDTFGSYCAAIFEHCATLDVVEWERPTVTAHDLQVEFDKIYPDIVLGIADKATIELAKNLRVQIKAMSQVEV